MSNYADYPPPPPSEGYGQAATVDPPPAIKTSVSIVWAVVALSIVGTILTVLFLDDIIKSAAGANLTSSEEDAARTGAVVGAVVGFVIFGGLWILLGVFLRKGAGWARIVLTVLAALGLLFSLVSLAGGQPALFLVLSLLQMGLYGALLFFMWKRESSDYIAAQKAR